MFGDLLDAVLLGDNLEVMRSLPRPLAHMVYMDPPFFTQQHHEGREGGFSDLWRWGPEAEEALASLEGSLAQFLGLYQGRPLGAYLAFLVPRILEAWELLFPGGSLYVHVAPNASHPLKVALDLGLKRGIFQNELVWKRTSTHNSAQRRYAPVHDVILFYAKAGAPHVFHPEGRPPNEEYVRQVYRYRDAHGRYRLQDLTASRKPKPGKEEGLPWRGVDPKALGSLGGRSWWAPSRKNLPSWLPIPEDWDSWGIHKRLDYLLEAGLIVVSKNGMPRIKVYWQEGKYFPLNDVIDHIPPVGATAKERTGYPTQKPLALLETLIRASTDPGMVVLDPFCGSGTTLVAARRLGRRYLGIDASPEAVALARKRLREPLPLLVPT